MSDQRNPYLPLPPVDGKHVFGPQGRDARCTACGAYSGSIEAVRPCVGEYAESSKMRSWAAQEWAKDRLNAGGAPRRVVEFGKRTPGGVRRRGIFYSGAEVYYLRLDCGDEREIDYDAYRMFDYNRATTAACVAPHCVMRNAEKGDRLNGWSPALSALDAFVVELEREYRAEMGEDALDEYEPPEEVRALYERLRRKARCDHDWRDARNEVVRSGEFCPKCMAVRAGNATTDGP